MKYCVIAHKYEMLKRGAYTTAQSLAKEFPEYITHVEENEVKSILNLSKEYDKIIFLTQMPSKYLFPVNVIKLHNLNHSIFIRSEHNISIFNSYTNGFHYYKEHNDIKNYVPILPRMPQIKMQKTNIPVYGFYSRKYMTPDAYWMFIDLLDNLKEKVNVITMGSPATEIDNHPKVNCYFHTYDNLEFFSKITHYVYPMSKVFIDPFPTSLYEAIQYRKKIIIPKQDRNFKDGINDILDCIEDDISLLDWENFKSFYLKLFKSNFVYNFDRMCYRKFNTWIKGEIIVNGKQ